MGGLCTCLVTAPRPHMALQGRDPQLEARCRGGKKPGRTRKAGAKARQPGLPPQQEGGQSEEEEGRRGQGKRAEGRSSGERGSPPQVHVARIPLSPHPSQGSLMPSPAPPSLGPPDLPPANASVQDAPADTPAPMRLPLAPSRLRGGGWGEGAQRSSARSPLVAALGLAGAAAHAPQGAPSPPQHLSAPRSTPGS